MIDEPGRLDRRTDGDRPRPRFSDRRHHLRPQRHSPRLPHRPQHDHRCARRARSKNTARTATASSSTRFRIQQTRDRCRRTIAELVNEDRIKGISAIRNESDLKEPVRLVIELKRDADPDVVLNQLYQFSPLQDTFSIILLALVDGKPRTLSLKELLRRVHPAPA